MRTRLILVLLILAPISLWGTSKTKTKKAHTPAKGAVAEGAGIFKDDCSLCHYADRADKKLGPGLKGLFKRKLLPASHKPVTEHNVREQIEKGNLHAKPVPMPSFGDQLNAKEMDELVKYLKTL